MKDMDKNQIKVLVNDEIKNFIKDELDKEMRKILHKSNSQTRDEMIKTIKDSLESVYKMLWQKRDFWKTDIK